MQKSLNHQKNKEKRKCVQDNIISEGDRVRLSTFLTNKWISNLVNKFDEN